MKYRLYYGWYVVALAALAYMIVMGTTYSAFGLLVVPVSKDLQLSRADMNTGLVLMNLGSTLWAPFIGRMLDRLSVKRIIIASVLLLGVSLFLLSSSHSALLSALILFGPLSMAVLGACNLSMSLLVGRWFAARRARAMALAMMGMSFGGLLFVPLIGLLVGYIGWRNALASAGFVGMLALLLGTALIRTRPGPQDSNIEFADAPANVMQETVGQSPANPAPVVGLLLTPRFWSMSISTGIVIGVMSALSVSLVPLAIEHGVSVPAAAGIVSISGGAGMVGKLLVSIFADRIDKVVLLSAAFLASALVAGMLLFETSYYALLGCSAVIGLANGIFLPTFSAVLAEQFGMGSFGTVRGLTIPVFTLLSAVALRFVGEVYDRAGSYQMAFATFFLVQLIAAVLMFLTRSFAGPRPRASSS